MTLVALALAEAVKARALALGFDRVAIGRAGAPEHAREFERWLDAGFAGSMGYLVRTRAERTDPARLLPGVRSVVSVALSYRPDESHDANAQTSADRPGGWAAVARYARGRDYHDVMRPRLEALVDFLREAAGPDVRSRPAVDTSAVLERDLAARAGLGWVGKNTNLLDASLGSYFFIGVVLTTAELETDGAVAERCGRCTACLDACPTNAFVAPYVLDARRCISYLTIEHRGVIDDALRPGIGDWLFGCDVCQEVCPWNRKARPARDVSFRPTVGLPPLASLVEFDEGAFRRRFRGTPLARSKRSGLARNAAIVLGNARDRGALPALDRATRDSDPSVVDAARWAIERIEADR
jgi:epoxyqueuosine reductase